MAELRRIVVGTDFTAPAAAGLNWMARAIAPGAEFHLVHVIEPMHAPPFIRGISVLESGADATANEQASERLRELASSFPAANITTHVRVGRPHEELGRVALEVGADVIVVGPHGESPRAWKWLGTTAERVARSAVPPVLIATNPGVSPPRKLLVAVDDAPVATGVLRWAALLAERFDAELTVLHVLSNAAVTHLASVSAATARDPDLSARLTNEALVTEGMRWLDAVSSSGVSLQRAKTRISFGKTGDTILEAAREATADMILMGRSGSGKVLPASIGSTVSVVLHGARCPVLVVGDALRA